MSGPCASGWRIWPHCVEQPLGPEVVAALARGDWLRRTDDRSLLAARLALAPDVGQETYGQPGAEDPEYVVLRRQRGMRRAERTDTATATLVGACDGQVRLGVLIDAVAALLGEDPQAMRAHLGTVARRLVADGFLTPA